MTVKSDLPQGTLDLLILKVVALGAVHGYAIAQRLQQVSRDVVQVPRRSLYPALHRLENRLIRNIIIPARGVKASLQEVRMQRILKGMTIVLGTALMFGQDAVVRRSTILIDTVKRGDMTQTAHGLGTLTEKMAAELKIPEAQARQITSGQAAFIDTRVGITKGTVVGINPAVVDGSVTVKVQLEGDLPAGVRPGLEVDGTIHIEELKDVVYVRRPSASGSPESVGTLFKLDPDKQHVTRVRVQYGRNFAHAIEVRSGLQAGDQVILSDMSAFNASNRLRLE